MWFFFNLTFILFSLRFISQWDMIMILIDLFILAKQSVKLFKIKSFGIFRILMFRVQIQRFPELPLSSQIQR